MKEIGIGFAMRKMANSTTPDLTIETDGSHWKLTQTSILKTTVTEFDVVC